MLSKLKSTAWFLRRPQYLPHAVHILKMKFKPDREGERDVAEAWCKAHAVDTQTALTQITGQTQIDLVEDLHQKRFAEALKVTEACPVKMGGAGDLNLLFHLARFAKAKRIIETGVAYGWSSLALLLAMEGKGKLTSIDLPYLQRNNDDFVGCAVPDDLRKDWKLIRKSDRMALKQALADLGTLDLCHYDSDKTYYGRLWAYPILWDALRSGGVFLSDDIGDNVGFQEFAEGLGIKPIVVNQNNRFVGVLIKP